MDLKDRFDLATSGGPEHRPLEGRLTVGRRAQARRRTTVAAGAVAAIIAVGGTGWAALPGDARSDRETRVATSPSPTPTDAYPDPLSREQGGALFTYQAGGTFVALPGAAIQRRIDDIVDYPDAHSMAAIVTYEGKTYWMAAAQFRGSGWANEEPAIEGRTFEQWVRDQVVLRGSHMGDDSDWDYGWVTLGADGVLTPHKGATIIEQSSPARLDQAPADVPSAQAIIEVDGARLCVVARDLPGDVVPVIYDSEAEFKGCTNTFIGWGYPGDAAGNQ